MLAVGVERLPARITEVAPTVLRHFEIEPPSYSIVTSVAA